MNIKNPIKKKRVYTIIGTNNSGKTVFLTALLHHLEEGKAFPGLVKEFDLDKRMSSFPALKYWKEIQKERWPEKTIEASTTRCKFYWGRKKVNRCTRLVDLTLHDIPGERVADALIWKYDKFSEWSNAYVNNLRNDADAGLSHSFLEVFDAAEDAARIKDAFKKMLGNYVKKDLFDEVSPSSFILTPFEKEGAIKDPRKMDEESWQAYCLSERIIGCSGDDEFFPVPDNMFNVDKELKSRLQKNYNAYRNNVVKPVFSKIQDSNGLVVLWDILLCLQEGDHRKRSVVSVVESVVRLAGKDKVSKKIIKTFSPKRIGTSRRVVDRMAHVVSKEDLISPDHKDRLKALLKSEVDVLRDKNIDIKKHEIFTCAAVPVAEVKGSPEKLYYHVLQDGKCVPKRDSIPHVPLSWPKKSDLGQFEYKFNAIPHPDMFDRPSGLDLLLEFMCK